MTDDTIDGAGPSRLSTSELCRRAGVTPRQADYWTRMGLLHAVVAARGSGTQRKFDEAEIGVARLLAFTMPWRHVTASGSEQHAMIGAGIEHALALVRRGRRGLLGLVPGVILDLDLICGDVPDTDAVAV